MTNSEYHPIRAIAGVLLMVGGFALFAWGLVNLLHTGTCASGGPYVSARQCPDDIGLWIGGLTVGVLGGLAGAALFLLRGRRPGRDGTKMSDHLSWGLVLWGVFFTAAGLVALYGAFGPGSTDAPGAKLGAGIVAGIFIPMGLIPLIFELRSASSDAKQGEPPSSPLGDMLTQASSLASMAQTQAAPARTTQGFSEEGLRKLAQMQRASPSAAPVATDHDSGLTSSGNATIKSFKYLGKSGVGETLVEFGLEVVAGGNPAPYEVVHEQMVPLDRAKTLAQGGSLRVRVDRDNPAELTIEW